MNIFGILKNYLRFIDTITTKLLTLVLFITVIPLMVVANFSSGIINQIMLDSSKNELNFNLLLTKNKYNQELSDLKETSIQIKNFFVKESYNKYLNNRNKAFFTEELLKMKKDYNLDICLILDSTNKIVRKTNKKDENKDYSILKLIEKSFSSDKIITSTEVLSDVKYVTNIGNKLSGQIGKDGLYSIVAVPISDSQDKIRAVLLIGKTLKSKEIPELIKTLTGATLTIYQLFDDELRIIVTGKKLSPEENLKAVLLDKNLFEQIKKNNQTLIKTENSDEIGQNEVIKDYSGNIIGTMYIGISESKFTHPGDSIVGLISIISVISLIVSIFIAALFARTITTPILKLVIAAKSISSGYLHQRVKIRGSDEIAQLSATFNQMADNLYKQERLKDNFVATLTHDLKVPMLAENQTISYLLKETYGPITEEQKDVLELIKSTNNSSLEMVSTLLEIYRYDSGNVNLLKTEFDIVNLMKNSIDQIKSLAEDKKIIISLSSSEDRIFINADEREIKRVIHNLISNAITNGIHRGQIQCDIQSIKDIKETYYPETSIDLYTTLENPVTLTNNVLISIKDDGIGISREDMQELFKRFSLNRGRKPSGTGLGLYYSYQVITRHKGIIWAESAEGKGSSFRFILPVKE